MYIQRNRSFVRIAFVLLLILATTGKAATLPPLRYQSFSNLKSETQTLVVKAIVQDSSGMMWFVDKKALSAWDGYNLHRYTHPEQSDMGSPRCALVVGGSILVGHEHGLLQFNLNTRSFQRDSLYDDIDVRCLVQVGTDVWAGTSRGLFCNGRYVRLKEVENVCALAAVGDSLLYVGQQSGLSCYSIPTGRLHVLHTLIPREGARASSTIISALLWQPSDSTLWVGTDAGLGTLDQLEQDRLQFDLPIVKCLAFDTEGNILAGTDDGLYVMDHRQRLWHLSHDALNDAKTIASNVVWTLCSDVGGNLWVGTSNGVSMSPRSIFLHNYPLPAITASREGNQMRFIFQDSDSTLWLGGINGLIAVEGLDTDHQSCRWYKMNDKQWPIPHNSIRCMFEDSDHRVWVGIDGALLLYNRRSQQFRPLHIDGDRRNWVYDIQETTDGKLRVTTYQATYTVSPDRITADGVVAVLQRENAQPYTPQGCSAVTPGGTWTVTDEGLRITDARQQVLISFSMVDSYTSVYYNPVSQTVWLGGIDKFAAVRAGDLHSQQQAATPVVTNVEVMGQGYCDALQLNQHDLQLNQSQNCLLFYLSNYEYGTEKTARFAFRVDGLQEEWVQLPAGSSTLLLSGLQPGSYTLFLSDARQQEAAYSLHFRILPPWYRSRLAWMLYALFVVVLLTLVGLYVRSRYILRRERQEKELILQNARSKEEQLSEDKAMLEQELRLSMLATSGNDTQLSQDDQLLLRVTHIIEENIDNSDLSVDMLSQLSGISTKQLYRKIKQLTGRTAVGYIRHLRLKKAARLLTSKESFSTKEVMYLTGFSNASYFTRCFQEEYGVTPSNYSKMVDSDKLLSPL